jgi:hypothetical protein
METIGYLQVPLMQDSPLGQQASPHGVPFPHTTGAAGPSHSPLLHTVPAGQVGLHDWPAGGAQHPPSQTDWPVGQHPPLPSQTPLVQQPPGEVAVPVQPTLPIEHCCGMIAFAMHDPMEADHV